MSSLFSLILASSYSRVILLVFKNNDGLFPRVVVATPPPVPDTSLVIPLIKIRFPARGVDAEFTSEEALLPFITEILSLNSCSTICSF